MYEFDNEIITPEFILETYTQKQIFSIIFGEQIKPNVYICSPFRKDRRPGCWLEYFKDKLWFIDFADIKKSRDCFEIIKDKYNLSFIEACYFIHNKLKNNSVILSNFQIKQTIKSLFNIGYSIRKSNIEDKNYWSAYSITKANLIEDKVYPISKYYTIGFQLKDFIVYPQDITYAITLRNTDVKIYRPLTQNKRKKWFTNCRENYLGNIDSLPVTGKTLIYTKSYKDCRVIRNQGFNSCWFQNEVSLPKNLHIFKELFLRFDTHYILFDNDSTGINFSNLVQHTLDKEFNLKTKSIFINSPNCKDSADLVKNFGEKQLKDFLIYNTQNNETNNNY